MDADRFDILVLDGEAAKVGGLGLAKQLKNEIFDCPPIIVLTGRPQDSWLAAWSQADLAVPHPLDPIALTSAVATLARAAVAQRLSMASDRVLTWPTLLTDLIAGRDLDRAATRVGDGPDHGGRGQPGPGRRGFLVGLRAKGESVAEMEGLAEQMLAHANRIEVAGPSLDIVGTGGDRAHTVNISTMASMVAAAAGVPRRQARQPGGVLVVGVGRRARGARGST